MLLTANSYMFVGTTYLLTECSYMLVKMSYLLTEEEKKIPTDR